MAALGWDVAHTRTHSSAEFLSELESLPMLRNNSYISYHNVQKASGLPMTVK